MCQFTAAMLHCCRWAVWVKRTHGVHYYGLLTRMPCKEFAEAVPSHETTFLLSSQLEAIYG